MNIKIKRLHPDAIIPKYAHEGDAGFDLVAAEDVIIEPGETVKIDTGIAIEVPKGYELQIRPRSGITLRTSLRVQLGTIDSNYRGEIGVIIDNIYNGNDLGEIFDIKDNVVTDFQYGDYPHCSYLIRKGDRVAQGVIAPVVQATFEEVDELTESERGENGFGSSGV